MGGPAADAESRNLAVASTAPEVSDKRVALVIGNGAYTNSPLKNPVNDAADMAAKLRSLGFDVVERTNLKTSQIGRTLRDFRSRLSPGAVALFFYAGHGLQIKGENYLPAVDADIEGEEDVPNQSIAVRQVMELMGEANTRMNLAFLDACRNNPYARGFRSLSEGLARVSAPSGTLISFATRPGSVAADGTGRNGLYTSQLLAAIDAPNLPVELMLKRVVSGVKSASKGMQEPWMEGSIEGEFEFRTEAVAAAAPSRSQEDIDREKREAIDRALHDADSRAAEREARLQAAQKAATEQAVQEAVRRANEQAARERAELQAAMQKMVQEALASQKELLREQEARMAAERPAGAATASPATPAAPPAPVPVPVPVHEAVAQPAPVVKPAAAQAAAATPAPVVVASLGPAATSGPGPAASAAAADFGGVQVGDQWEYQSNDEFFGVTRQVVWSVKAVDPNDGVLEELRVNDRPVRVWAFTGTPEVIAAPVGALFVIGPHWRGGNFDRVPVHGIGDCVGKLHCVLTGTATGREQVTVLAGTFDADVVSGTISGSGFTAVGKFKFWYSRADHRLVRQDVDMRARGAAYLTHETIELKAIHRATKQAAL